jgi:hypothetical protein
MSSPEIAGNGDLLAALRTFLEDTQWISPDLRGSDLIEMGVPRGPAVGQAMTLLRRVRVEGSVVDEEGERQIIRAWLVGQGDDAS